ncbi:v-SNARE protein [Starmerella bacillaris]|uniref:V-SNARE protein n=1 Tax=Starmerella bacillaris TaxID=1247836 RepID=A0AAV5RMT8_STABA|nr:v-SNARE protein [Starmerella bacillaris]
MSSRPEYLSSLDSELQFVLSELREQTTVSDDLIEEAYQLVERMVISVNALPTDERAQHNATIRSYRSEIDEIKKNLALKQSQADQTARNELFGDRDYADAGSEQRSALLNNQQRLERSSDRLRDAQRVGNETESIGAGILNDLRGQREQIINSRNTLTEADGHVDRSMRTLRGMARRMAANKLLSYAIIAVLVLLILFVLASKFM